MYLVTGATGYIGRRLIRLLVERYKKENILCLVRPTDGTQKEQTGLENLRSLGVRTYEADLLSPETLTRVPKSPEAVFHLASCTDTSAKDHSINDVGTRNLFEAIGPLVPGTPVIFTSSIAVNDGRTDYSKPMTENDPLPVMPFHVYGRRKLLTEQFLMQRARVDGFCLSIVRVCGVYGEDSIEKGLYSSLKKLVLSRSWLCRLNWPGRVSSIFVDDMAWFLRELMDHRPGNGQSELYIPSIQALSIGQMCEAYAKAYGIPHRVLELPGWIWAVLEWMTGRKRLWEKILPHKIYNTVWQANILVGQGYWNESVKVPAIFGTRQLTRFEEFCRRVAQKDLGRVV